MADRRDPVKRATDQAARMRVELRKVSALALEQRRELVRIRVSPMLEDPDDFWVFIGEENVINDAGRIDDEKLARKVRELLARKPELAKHDTL